MASGGDARIRQLATSELALIDDVLRKGGSAADAVRVVDAKRTAKHARSIDPRGSGPGHWNRKVEINFTTCFFAFHKGKTYETGANRKVGLRCK